MILAFYTESRIYYQHNEQYNKNLLYLPTLEGAQGAYIQIPTDLILSDFVSWLVLWVLRWQPHGLSPVSRRATGFRGHKIIKNHRQTNTQTGRRTDGQTVGRTDTQKEGQTDRQRPTNEQTHKEADRQQTHIWRDVSTNKQTNNHRLTQHWSRGI